MATRRFPSAEMAPAEMVIKRARKARGLAFVAVIVVALALTACTTTVSKPNRPDPTVVVTKYLTALVDGDTATARALDARAFDEAPFTQGDGTGFLATDALATAVQRIDVRKVKLVAEDAEGATVESKISLSGKFYTPWLRLSWNDDDKKWELIDSLANLIEVRVVKDQVPGPVPFTLSGFAPSGGFDGVDPPVSYVYPGVYQLGLDIGSAKFADPAAWTPGDTVTVEPYYQAPHKGELMRPVDFKLA